MIAANKFFPITENGKQYPLCERDYFRRLNLLCYSCGEALRGSYITALDNKYHLDHFTCSICPTVFGPQDSYYEHESKVYCHYHYSVHYAVKCAGCRSAILKQFVEINRNGLDEHWHPECYMINKVKPLFCGLLLFRFVIVQVSVANNKLTTYCVLLIVAMTIIVLECQDVHCAKGRRQEPSPCTASRI